MKFLRKAVLWLRREKEDEQLPDKIALFQELRKAHTEWMCAQKKLEWVLDKDQIDYAIFALEAAEKRYIMLLRQAKQFHWQEMPQMRAREVI